VGAKPLYFAGGGVTFTGGEPTLQFFPLRDCLAELRAQGIHTCVESNASHPRLPELFPLIGFLILDCKHHDSALHEKWTGEPNAPVLANIRAAAQQREQLLVRIPLVGGVNALQADAHAFAALLPSLGDFPVELLRYHEYGKPKWAQHGMAYTMQDAEVSPEQAARFAEILRQAGMTALYK
jgi:pyruvate formate lyase activating enzyme